MRSSDGCAFERERDSDTEREAADNIESRTVFTVTTTFRRVCLAQCREINTVPPCSRAFPAPRSQTLLFVIVCRNNLHVSVSEVRRNKFRQLIVTALRGPCLFLLGRNGKNRAENKDLCSLTSVCCQIQDHCGILSH